LAGLVAASRNKPTYEPQPVMYEESPSVPTYREPPVPLDPSFQETTEGTLSFGGDYVAETGGRTSDLGADSVEHMNQLLAQLQAQAAHGAEPPPAVPESLSRRPGTTSSGAAIPQIADPAALRAAYVQAEKKQRAKQKASSFRPSTVQADQWGNPIVQQSTVLYVDRDGEDDVQG